MKAGHTKQGSQVNSLSDFQVDIYRQRVSWVLIGEMLLCSGLMP